MSQENKLTVEQSELFHQWKSHPVTLQLFQLLRQKREDLKELWANGHFSAAFDTEMMVKNAGATGAASAYQEVLSLEASDIFGDSDEE